MKPYDNVAYLDNHVLVFWKRAGITTQPELVEEAKAFLKEEFAKPGNVFCEPIHRLDRVVSGWVLFARTSKALSRLMQAMREKKIRKTYLAEVSGQLPDGAGTLKHRLVHGDRRAIIDPRGKEAILHYRQRGKEVLIDLETGRYHQIRAQLSHMGCPIDGDGKYGSKCRRDEGIALSHIHLTFPHPITGEMVEI